MNDKLVTLSKLAEFKSQFMTAVEAEGYVTASVNNLANYYLKTQTYSKTEVDTLVAAIKQFTYKSVETLPTASANTMNIIHLVPAESQGETNNAKAEYITIDNGEQAQTRYTWEKIGDTRISLAGYVTTQDLNTALTSYTTSTDLTQLLAGKQDKIDTNHKLSADLLQDGNTNKVLTADEKTKLANIEAGAQVNVIEAIQIATGNTDSNATASINNKTATLLIASSADIDALFAA